MTFVPKGAPTACLSLYHVPFQGHALYFDALWSHQETFPPNFFKALCWNAVTSSWNISSCLFFPASLQVLTSLFTQARGVTGAETLFLLFVFRSFCRSSFALTRCWDQLRECPLTVIPLAASCGGVCSGDPSPGGAGHAALLALPRALRGVSASSSSFRVKNCWGRKDFLQ